MTAVVGIQFPQTRVLETAAMRRHRGPHASYTRGSASPLPETVSLIRTFNSETNPARPVRPSPLTKSAIPDMPLDMLDRIRSFPLFQSAPETFLAAIGAHLRPQSHAPHDYILTEGDDAKAMYWLFRGAVAVTSRDGESTYAELKPGAFFGEIGVLMGIPRTATIVARTRCLLVVLKKEDLAKELPNFPDVERAIREEAQERLAILESKKKEGKAVGRDSSIVTAGRGEKRAYEDEDGNSIMGESNTSNTSVPYSNNNKKRKSPSPGLVEAVASSALGSGLVHIRHLLKELPLFSNLPSEILHFLGSNAQPRNFPPFTDIIKQDSQGREIYFIVRGEVEVIDEKLLKTRHAQVTNRAGRTIPSGLEVKARLRQGNYFGEVASLSLAPRRTATVRSVSLVECLLITGDVLSEFWKRCPPNIKEQVEKTAMERLSSTSENDIVMKDVVNTPPIDELAIGERISKSQNNKPVPKMTVDSNKLENSHRPSRIEDRSTSEPLDPDPYLNPDLDNVRMKSRRSSLAPVSPEAPQENGQKKLATTAMKVKHSTAPPDPTFPPKRTKMVSQRPSHFSRGALPANILTTIFSYLELHHLMRARRVSTQWAKMLKESRELLHYLDLSKYNRKVTDAALTSSICPFVGSRPRYIDISNCSHVTDAGFTTLAFVCGANVRTWKMKSVWDVSAVAIHEMIKQAKELEDVDLSNCRKVNDALLMHIIGNVPLQPPPLSNQAYSSVRQFPGRPTAPPNPPAISTTTILGSQKLKKISLSYCKHVTDRSMAHIANFARLRLEEVDLTRCTTITDHGFEAWGQHQFARLTKLCLADCTYLTDNAIIFLTNAAPGLRYLDLVSISSTTSSIGTFANHDSVIANQPQSFCCALSDTATEVLALGCPYLMHLNLAFCGSAVSDSSLQRIGLHLLEMRWLSVRGCVRVTGAGVEAVVEGCHKVMDMDISQCKNTTMWLGSGGLSRVRPNVRFRLLAGG